MIAVVTCLLSGLDKRCVKENREIIKRHNNKQKQYCWFQDLLFTISRILEPEEGGKCSMCINTKLFAIQRDYFVDFVVDIVIVASQAVLNIIPLVST